MGMRGVKIRQPKINDFDIASFGDEYVFDFKICNRAECSTLAGCLNCCADCVTPTAMDNTVRVTVLQS